MMIVKKEEKNLILTGQCVPSFQSGEYEISTYIDITNPEISEQSQEEIKHFFIKGPRFLLEKDHIHSVYPAPGEYCSRGQILPHIVVSPCTIPFECAVTEREHWGLKVPYLTLLLFYENEMPDLKHGLVKDMFESARAGSLFYPKDVTKEEEEQACTFIDVPGDLFFRIAPDMDEMTLLVHGRKIDPQLKAFSLSGQMPQNDVQSVVFCNRIPCCGTDENPCRNHVCLVSLAGCEGIWNSKEEPSLIRLSVLHHWEFFAVSEKEEDILLQNVYTRPMTLPISETKKMDEKSKEILLNGYVPLPHTLREGSKTVSFYRSPLIPDCSRKQVMIGDSPDILYRYDPEIGMFDVSYCSAWELGKLIALSQEDIAKRIMRARNETLQRYCRNSVGQMLCAAGVELNLEKQLLRFFEKCYGEKEDEIMVSDRDKTSD